MLAGEQTLDEIVLNSWEWYRENHITLHAGKKVVEVDRVRRLVRAEDGTQEAYDRLLLATGSNPFILPVPGKDLEGVIAYRDIADTNAMIEAARHYRKAVVIGGGLLGLEAANGLKIRGMDVTVVHVMPWLMERQLDDVAGRMLQKSLEDRGLEFLIGAQTQELVGGQEGRVKAVKFKDGSQVDADLVVMAVGIRPNTELAEKMRLHCNRGIVVHDTMQTVTDAGDIRLGAMQPGRSTRRRWAGRVKLEALSGATACLQACSPPGWEKEPLDGVSSSTREDPQLAGANRSARVQRMTGIGRRCDMRRDGSLMAGRSRRRFRLRSCSPSPLGQEPLCPTQQGTLNRHLCVEVVGDPSRTESVYLTPSLRWSSAPMPMASDKRSPVGRVKVR